MFVLLKILLYLFRPLIWILILFIIAITTKNQNRKRLLFKIAIIALFFFTNPFIIRKCIAWYEVKPVAMQTLSKYNAGILLGGMVSYNKYDDQGYFNPDLLISSAMHLPRAQMVFKKVGINADLYPCDFVSKRIFNNFFEDYVPPSSYALGQWDNLIKEIVGIVTYKITGKG